METIGKIILYIAFLGFAILAIVGEMPYCTIGLMGAIGVAIPLVLSSPEVREWRGER